MRSQKIVEFLPENAETFVLQADEDSLTERMKEMSKGTIVALSVVGLVLILGISVFVWTMNVKGTEIGIRNRFLAQEKVVETVLDQMRKTIMNKHSVTKEYADNFLKVVTANAEGRKGGMGMKWVQESSVKLGIDEKIFLDMMNTVEGQVAGFATSQRMLVDIWREHATWCQNPWRNWIIGDRAMREPEMITSEVAKDAVRTKKMDDNLLGK